MNGWPAWWEYELALSPHLLKRMTDRVFTETDLRAMLDDATSWHPSVVVGRCVIATVLRDQPWEVVVEPDDFSRVLVVVTAYQVESR